MGEGNASFSSSECETVSRRLEATDGRMLQTSILTISTEVTVARSVADKYGKSVHQHVIDKLGDGSALESHIHSHASRRSGDARRLDMTSISVESVAVDTFTPTPAPSGMPTPVPSPLTFAPSATAAPSHTPVLSPTTPLASSGQPTSLGFSTQPTVPPTSSFSEKDDDSMALALGLGLGVPAVLMLLCIFGIGAWAYSKHRRIESKTKHATATSETAVSTATSTFELGGVGASTIRLADTTFLTETADEEASSEQPVRAPETGVAGVKIELEDSVTDEQDDRVTIEQETRSVAEMSTSQQDGQRPSTEETSVDEGLDDDVMLNFPATSCDDDVPDNVTHVPIRFHVGENPRTARTKSMSPIPIQFDDSDPIEFDDSDSQFEATERKQPRNPRLQTSTPIPGEVAAARTGLGEQIPIEIEQIPIEIDNATMIDDAALFSVTDSAPESDDDAEGRLAASRNVGPLLLF